MADVIGADGKIIRTYSGLQVRQYRDALHKAGMLAPVLKATGAERRRLLLHASRLVRDLRHGAVSTSTKEHAAQLGLRVYPNNVYQHQEEYR